MLKNKGSSKIGDQFLDRLDKDAQDNEDVFSEETKMELIGILKDYAPEARKYVMAMPRPDRDTQFVNWMLTMRVVEFKALKASEALEICSLILNSNFTKRTKESLEEKLQELKKWLDAI